MTFRTAALFVAAVTLFAGCGKPTKRVVTVTGTISYNGQKLKSGVVKFIAPNGDYAQGIIKPDGEFAVTDVVPGEQKVGYLGGPVGSGSSDGAKAGPGEKSVSVPMKFSDPNTSGVTVTVPEKGGPVTIELKG